MQGLLFSASAKATKSLSVIFMGEFYFLRLFKIGPMLHHSLFSNAMKHRSKFRGNTSSQGWEAKVIQPPRRWGKRSDFFCFYITFCGRALGGN